MNQYQEFHFLFIIIWVSRFILNFDQNRKNNIVRRVEPKIFIYWCTCCWLLTDINGRRKASEKLVGFHSDIVRKVAATPFDLGGKFHGLNMYQYLFIFVSVQNQLYGSFQERHWGFSCSLHGIPAKGMLLNYPTFFLDCLMYVGF